MEIKTITLAMPMGMGSVNCYLVRTQNGFILVDCGMGNSRKQLLEALEASGCKPGNLQLLILTHGDFDHSGNAAYIKRIYNVPVAMHPGDVQMVTEGDMFASRGNINKFLRKFISLFFGLKKSERFRIDHSLKDGDSLDNFGLEATIIELPGHSKGSIGVLIAKGDFFCGDMLVNSKSPMVNTLIDEAAQMSTSYVKLRKLPIQRIYPGHGLSFTLDEMA